MTHPVDIILCRYRHLGVHSAAEQLVVVVVDGVQEPKPVLIDRHYHLEFMMIVIIIIIMKKNNEQMIFTVNLYPGVCPDNNIYLSIYTLTINR